MSDENGPLSIIICHSDMFVSNDISLAVAEWDDRAVVLQTGSPAETLAAIAVVGTPVALICSASPEKLRTSGVAAALRARQGRLLVLYDGLTQPDDPDFAEWVWLDMPFTTGSLHDALDRLREGLTPVGHVSRDADPQPDLH